MEKIGLIAGNGSLPIIFAQAARNKGVSLTVIGINEETDKSIADYADKIYWISVGQLGSLIEILKKEKIEKAVMAGQIRHKLLFSDIKLDDEFKALLSKIKDKKTDTILGAVAARIGQLGVKLIDSSYFIKDYLPSAGVLTKKGPTPEQKEDIEFGLKIAKAIAGLDIGQSVVVKNKAVLSVEAIEGTDEAISRGSKYSQGGAVVVKVSKPNQDMRFDIPLIGKQTIKTMIDKKAAVLAIEAGKTFFLDQDYVIAEADKHGIVIIAV
jgi:DUF1009 family protein